MVKNECMIMTGIFSEVEVGADYDGDKLMSYLVDGVRKFVAVKVSTEVAEKLKEKGSTNERFTW